MKLILFPLTEIRNFSNDVETERKLVPHYQCPSTLKNALTRVFELAFRRPRMKSQHSLVIFQGCIRLLTRAGGNGLLLCKLFTSSGFIRIFWSAYGRVYAIHKASLMRNLSHSSLLNTASGSPLLVTAFRERKSCRKIQSHQWFCRSKSTPLPQSGKAAGEKQRSQSTGVTYCHAEELSAKIQLQDCQKNNRQQKVCFASFQLSSEITKLYRMTTTMYIFIVQQSSEPW